MLQIPKTFNGGESVCWLYTIALDKKHEMQRDELIRRLLLNGIEARPVFYPLHVMPPYQKYADGKEFPVSNSVSSRGLSLPSSIKLNNADITEICNKFSDLVEMRQLFLGKEE
jgi:perosamine synthetase